MPSMYNNKGKAVCGPSSVCNKKNILAWRRTALSTIVLFFCVPRFLHGTMCEKIPSSFFSSQVPGIIRHTTTKASGTRHQNMNVDHIDTYVIPAPRYQVWYAIRTPQWVRTQSNIPADIFMLQVNLARGGTTAWKLWYQHETPRLAWTSPVQLEDISRASSTNSTRFWTRAEVWSAAK